MKKLSVKKYAACVLAGTFVLAGFTSQAFAQTKTETTDDSSLVLPDISTTVSGDSIKSSPQSVPDFQDVVPALEDSYAIVPVLPGVEESAVPFEKGTVSAGGAPEKEIYAEGQIGAGYPGFFSGVFSIYKDSEVDPFSLQFTQLTENGFGLHPASSGFFNSDTSLVGTKTFRWGALDLNVGGSFSSSNLGLQSLSTTFYNTSKQDFSTQDSIVWNLPNGFLLKAGVDAGYYIRYSGVKDSSAVYIPQLANGTTLYAAPSATASWHNDMFSIAFDAGYTFQSIMSQVDYPSYKKPLNRAEFGIDFDWTMRPFTAGLDASIVVGNKLGSASFLVPFTVNFAGEWAVNYCPASLTVNVEGGLESSSKMYSQLENEFQFAAAEYLPGESSDWYGLVQLGIPVMQNLAIETDITFKKSAFGNGTWEADYTTDDNGLYKFNQVDRYLLDTDISGNFSWSMFNVEFGVNGHWMHVPSNDYRVSIAAAFSVLGDNGQWGADVSIREPIGNNGGDFIPVIGFGGFYRLGNSLRLALEVEDFAKLVSGTDRHYYGSQYFERAGNVTLLLKFFF